MQQICKILTYGEKTTCYIYEEKEEIEQECIRMYPAGECQQAPCLQHTLMVSPMIACLQPGNIRRAFLPQR